MASSLDTHAVTIDHDDTELLRVTMSGEVDLTIVTDEVRETVANSDAASAVVDLSAVTFMDTTGLALIVAVRNRIPRTPTLLGASNRLRQLLTITGLDDLFAHAAA